MFCIVNISLLIFNALTLVIYVIIVINMMLN